VRSRVALLLALGALTLPALSQATFSAPTESGRSAPAQAAVPAAPDVVPVALRERYDPDPQPARPRPRPRPKPRPRRSIFPVARLRASVALRARPRGRVAARVAPSTEFGSPQVLGVAAKRGRWLGVVSTALPNNRLAWVRRDDPAVRPARVGYSLHADLSARRVELRRDGRAVKRLRVAIGRPGSPTPTGRFAITDKLRGTDYGSYYGCCILALSGHQPNTPPGWTGGDRLAIHGTNAPGTIGQPASAGCLRAADADLQLLMRRVRLGTPVFIRP
jgi:L,D-transpeptidase-like protein